ncbi:hypothetical protein MRB53_036260 [Persea americana]|nr:hypothetical protein MRB53_036703 [Persea americana]KAJ8614772.1 hypothetical protein MRB53_036438 [Persea americana]KAJ8614847.1 hypothetical protein MRB53_036260 [Persea americana]
MDDESPPAKAEEGQGANKQDQSPIKEPSQVEDPNGATFVVPMEGRKEPLIFHRVARKSSSTLETIVTDGEPDFTN